MSGHKRCQGQWPLKEGYSADPIECSQSNVSPERELQVLGEIKKKKEMTGKCLQGSGTQHVLNFNSIIE